MSRRPILFDSYFWAAIWEALLPSLRDLFSEEKFVAKAVTIFVMFLALSVGCVFIGPLVWGGGVGTATVRGKLRVDGSYVDSGTIQLIPKHDGQPYSAEIEAGDFLIKKVLIGHYRVLCVSVRPTGEFVTEGTHGFPELVNVIPEPYRQGVDIKVEANAEPLVLDWWDK